MARQKSLRRGRKPSIGTAAAKIHTVRRSLKGLVTELARIENRLDDLDKYYARLTSKRGRGSNDGATKDGSARGRGPNIRDLAAETLKRARKPMPLREIASRVLKAKRSKGGTYFVQNLGIALGSDRRFKRSGRGISTLR